MYVGTFAHTCTHVIGCTLFVTSLHPHPCPNPHPPSPTYSHPPSHTLPHPPTALVGPTGTVLAYDRDATRLQRLQRTIDNVGASGHVQAHHVCVPGVGVVPGVGTIHAVPGVVVVPAVPAVGAVHVVPAVGKCIHVPLSSTIQHPNTPQSLPTYVYPPPNVREYTHHVPSPPA